MHTQIRERKRHTLPVNKSCFSVHICQSSREGCALVITCSFQSSSLRLTHDSNFVSFLHQSAQKLTTHKKCNKLSKRDNIIIIFYGRNLFFVVFASVVFEYIQKKNLTCREKKNSDFAYYFHTFRALKFLFVFFRKMYGNIFGI